MRDIIIVLVKLANTEIVKFINQPDGDVKLKMIKFGFVSIIALALGFSSSFAQDENTENQLQIPADLQVKPRGDLELQEYRIGGRLERVVVTRDRGFTEIYQNNRRDSLWAADETDLGEVQNVRQWRLGSW